MIEEVDLGFSTNLYLIDPGKYIHPASEVAPEEYFYEDLKSASIAKLPNVYRTLTTIAQLLDSADRGTGADRKPNSSGFSEEAQADPLTRYFKLDNAGYFSREQHLDEPSTKPLDENFTLRGCADILIDHILEKDGTPSESEERD